MNKRMREPFHTLMWKASIGYNDSWSQIDPEVLEKFAELLIRECAGILVKEVEVALDASGNPVSPEDFIKEHFGVK